MGCVGSGSDWVIPSRGVLGVCRVVFRCGELLIITNLCKLVISCHGLFPVRWNY